MLDSNTLARLDAMKERVALSGSDQVRRGAERWLESREWRARHREHEESSAWTGDPEWAGF